MGNRNKKALTRSFLYSVELAWKFMAWWHLPRSRGTSITWAQSRALKTFFEFRWLTKTSPFRKKPRHWKNRQLRKKRTLQEDGFDWKKALNFFILLWCFLVNFYFLAKWTFFHARNPDINRIYFHFIIKKFFWFFPFWSSSLRSNASKRGGTERECEKGERRRGEREEERERSRRSSVWEGERGEQERVFVCVS